MLVPILLGAIAPQATIATTVPKARAFGSVDRTLTGDHIAGDHTASDDTAGDPIANKTAQEPPDPNAQSLPGEQPSTQLPTHLSGASLLFLIWLVAEQVSADWFKAIGSDPSGGQPSEARPPQPLPVHTP